MDAKAYKCESCGYRWKVGPGATPESAACPACGGECAAVLADVTAARKAEKKGKGSRGDK